MKKITKLLIISLLMLTKASCNKALTIAQLGAKLATEKTINGLAKIDTFKFESRKFEILLKVSNKDIEKSINSKFIAKLTANGRFIFENDLVKDSLIWKPYSLDSTLIYLSRKRK